MDKQLSPVPDPDESVFSTRSVISMPNSGDVVPVADAAGLLDLSGRDINALPSNCPRQPAIRVLNISSNAFRNFECSQLPLFECVEVNASDNKFSRIRCFAVLAKTLETLDLSGNVINSLETLNIMVNLRALNLSHNIIQTFPFLDRLAHLSVLDLNYNQLPMVPNLIKLTSLTELHLHGNRIRTIQDIHGLVPAERLRLLDISGNRIRDLSEIQNLYGFDALESLSISGNPCVRFKEEADKEFCYRPFVKSCVLGELKSVDGSLLSPLEIVKGEQMRLEGKTASFRPGEGVHARLCDYLRKECPPTPIEENRLQKVLEKRREYAQNTSGNSYANTSADETSSLALDTSRASRQSPFFGRKKTNFGAKTTKTVKSEPRSQTTTPTPLTTAGALNHVGTTQPTVIIEQRNPDPVQIPSTPTRLVNGTSSSSNVSSSTVILSRSEAPGLNQFRTDSPQLSVAPSSPTQDLLEQRIKDLEEFKGSVSSILEKLVPTPVCVKHKRLSPDSIRLWWDNTIPMLGKVGGYELSVNGTPVGRVEAAHRRVDLNDLDPEEECQITIQTISAFGGLRSAPAHHTVPRHDDDEKENDADYGSFSQKPSQ